MSRRARVGGGTLPRRCEMRTISLRETMTTERDREFWRGVLLAGGFTALPRWTQEPVPGIGEHDVGIPDELVAGLRLPDRRLPPRRTRADRGQSRCRARTTEPALRRGVASAA